MRFIRLIALSWAALSIVGASFADEKTEAEPPKAKPAEKAKSPVGPIPQPPTNLKAVDLPDDAGNGLLVTWDISPDDKDVTPRLVMTYELLRKKDGEADSEYKKVGEATYGTTTHEDKNNVEKGEKYQYRLVAISPTGARSEAAQTTEAAVPTMQYFNTTRAWLGITLLLLGGSIAVFIEFARSGKDLKIRKIAGLEAVDEAVGRATEMGRSVLFVPGIQDINDIQTVAGITVLSRVATTAARYDAGIEVPTARSLVMTTARETVEASFLGAGRPDAYREDDIYYLSDEQFGYVAGVTGTMMRKKPAACFYMGAFYAESLILAEVGNSIGAIQIAGTAMPSQLPFFIAACDYTLIGEEFFAASAYLSGEPHQLGSLKGQDLGKVVGVLLMLIGCAFATVMQFGDGIEWAETGFSFIKNNMLGDGGFLP